MAEGDINYLKYENNDCTIEDADGNNQRAILVATPGGFKPDSSAQSPSVSAFGELAIAPFDALTGWSYTYNINPAVINQEILDTGTVTNAEGKVVINTGLSATGMAKVETFRSSRYVPGVGGLARFTAVFSAPQADSKQVIGLINGSDGWAFGYNGTVFGILRKRDGVEDWIPQTSWNVDTRLDLDHTKGNVYEIKYQWLGYGMQYFYIENSEGDLSLVHVINYSNQSVDTSVLNPNLPLSAYVVNSGNTTPIELQSPSAIAGLNGDGLNDAISTNVGGDSLRAITAGDTPFLAFRMGDTYKGKANRLFSQALRLTTAADLNKPVIIRAYAGGTVNDGTWGYLSEEVSPIEMNNTLTSYTLGLLVGSFPLGKTDSQDYPLGITKFRFYAGQQIVLVASTAGAGDVVAGVNWKSFV